MRARREWYTGVIQAVHQDTGEVSVAYDDGEQLREFLRSGPQPHAICSVSVEPLTGSSRGGLLVRSARDTVLLN